MCLYGDHIFGFKTFLESMFTLLRVLLGDFEYDTQEFYQPQWAPYFFTLFTILVFFIFLNLLVAIILIHFTRVAEALEGLRYTWRREVPSVLSEVVAKIHSGLHPLTNLIWSRCENPEARERRQQQHKERANVRVFKNCMYECMWRAYCRQGNSINLFDRFERAYLTQNILHKDLYVGVDTLAEWISLKKDEETLEVVMDLIGAFHTIKSTHVLRPMEAWTERRFLNREQICRDQFFEVTKYTRWGVQQKRLFVIDMNAEEPSLRNYAYVAALSRLLVFPSSRLPPLPFFQTSFYLFFPPSSSSVFFRVVALIRVCIVLGCTPSPFSYRPVPPSFLFSSHKPRAK
jgi:hypothetical protein